MPQFGRETFTKVRFRGGAGSYILAPVLTTTQRDALTAEEGMFIFNSTTDQFEEYDGSTWQAVGQVILDTHAIDYGLHKKVVVKVADETVNNDNTLQNDDELYLAIAANETWLVIFVPLTNSSAAADMKYTVTVPSGATEVTYQVGWNAAGSPGVQIGHPFTGGGTAANFWTGLIHTIVKNGSTAGNVQLQWSQNTKEASNTTVKAGSFLIAHKIA